MSDDNTPRSSADGDQASPSNFHFRTPAIQLPKATDASSLDEKKRAATPYRVVEQNFTLERLQPQLGNRHEVFFTHPREVLSIYYERNPADPRISHVLTLEVDAFGNVLRSLTVAYGRRTPSTNPALTAEDNAKQSGGSSPTPKADDTKKQKRLIEHVHTLHRKGDFSALSALYKVESLALPGETYRLALTPSLLAQVFMRKQADQPGEALLPNPNALLEGKGSDQGRYVACDGNWWISSPVMAGAEASGSFTAS